MLPLAAGWGWRIFRRSSEGRLRVSGLGANTTNGWKFYMFLTPMTNCSTSGSTPIIKWPYKRGNCGYNPYKRSSNPIYYYLLLVGSCKVLHCYSVQHTANDTCFRHADVKLNHWMVVASVSSTKELCPCHLPNRGILLHQWALPMSPASRVACSMRSTTMRMGWPSLGLIYDWEAAHERRRHSALPRHCPWIPRVHRRRRCSVASKQKRLIGAHLVRTAPSKRGSSKFFEPTKRPKSCQAMVITRFSLVELLGVTVSIFCFQKIQSQMPAFTNVYSHEVLSFLVAETLDSDYISMGFIHRKKSPIFVCLGSGFSASPWKSKGFPGTRCSPPWISRLIYKYISIYLVP